MNRIVVVLLAVCVGFLWVVFMEWLSRGGKIFSNCAQPQKQHPAGWSEFRTEGGLLWVRAETISAIGMSGVVGALLITETGYFHKVQETPMECLRLLGVSSRDVRRSNRMGGADE